MVCLPLIIERNAHEICMTQECLQIARRLLWKQTTTHSIRNNNPMFHGNLWPSSFEEPSTEGSLFGWRNLATFRGRFEGRRKVSWDFLWKREILKCPNTATAQRFIDFLASLSSQVSKDINQQKCYCLSLLPFPSCYICKLCSPVTLAHLCLYNEFLLFSKMIWTHCWSAIH